MYHVGDQGGTPGFFFQMLPEPLNTSNFIKMLLKISPQPSDV